MILTITLNPSVDIRFTTAEFATGGIFRAQTDEQTAGGKGLNVSRVLHQLGSPVIATGFLGGCNGDFIRNKLDEIGIQHQFIQVKGNTRVCIAIVAGDTQTEVLGRGPLIGEEELAAFTAALQQLLPRTKLVCISGSLPRGIPPAYYRDLINQARKCQVKVLVDTSGEPLEKAAEAGPYLLKPNKKELESALQTKFMSERDIARGMGTLAARGCEIVLVTLGSAGALALAEDKLYRISIPKVEAVNPVGSGDSMLAGLAHALYSSLPVEEVLALGTACGISNAMQAQTGQIDPGQITSLARQVQIQRVNI